LHYSAENRPIVQKIVFQACVAASLDGLSRFIECDDSVRLEAVIAAREHDIAALQWRLIDGLDRQEFPSP